MKLYRRLRGPRSSLADYEGTILVDPTTRRVERTPVTLKIKFKSETLDQFIERYAVDVSPGGIFIRTKEPLTVGTPMKFEFQLRDASPLIAGEGTVVWTRDNDPSRPAVAPGMGVRFDRLAEGSQGVIDKILVQKAKQPQRPASDTAKPFTDMPTRVAPLPGTDAQRPHSNSKPFMDTPTRVAPLAMTNALFSGSDASAEPQFPARTPFQPDVNEFAPAAFEEATKVRSLEDLVAQTGQAGLFSRPGPTPSRHLVSSTANAEVAVGELASLANPRLSSQLPVAQVEESSVVSEQAEPPPLPRRPPTAPPQKLNIGGDPVLPVEAGEFRLTDRGMAEPAVSPSERARRTSSAFTDVAGEQAASVPVKRPSRAPAMFAILAIAAVGTAIWYFVLRDTTHEPVVTVPDTDAAETSAVRDMTGTGSDPIETPKSAAADVDKRPMVETEIASSAPKSIVTVVDTGQTGPAPLVAKLEKAKKYQVRVEAPGHLKAQMEIVGGQDHVTAKPEEKPHVLAVSSEPDGAQIFINNAATGKVTPATIELTASHRAKPRLRLQLRRAGYRWVDRVVEVAGHFSEDEAKMTLTVEVPLAAGSPDGATGKGGNAAKGKTDAASKTDAAGKADAASKTDAAGKSDAADKPDAAGKTDASGGSPHPTDAPGEHPAETRDHADPNKP